MMSQNSSIAFCIPTYNHPDVIQDVIGRMAETYKKYQVDIYVYDSSENDATQEAVTVFIDQGFDHIFYIRLASSLSVDEKLLLIFSGYGWKKQYDYIWPAKDRAYFTEQTLKIVVREIQDPYDAIFLVTGDYPWELGQSHYQSTIYDQPEEFFYDWGWLVTSLETTIFNYKTLLAYVDWQEFKELYFVDKCHGFDHLVALFMGLANLKNPLIRVLKEKDIFVRCAQGAQSSWIMNTFRIWIFFWSRAIRSLPDCYNSYKAKVMKQTTMLPWILGSHSNLIHLKQMGVLTEESFALYQDVWKDVSDIPIRDVHLILENRYSDLIDSILSTVKELFVKREYEKICVIFLVNGWIATFVGEGNYKILQHCVQIYKMELDRDNGHTFLDGLTCMEDIIEKYQLCKYLLWRLEYGIAEDMQGEMLSCIQQQKLTVEELAVIMVQVCVDHTKVYEKLAQLYESNL